MWIRKEVWSLAGRLAAASGIVQDHIYWWLMGVGKHHGKNPTRMAFSAGPDRVVCLDDPDSYLQVYDASKTFSADDYDGPDYEDLILARQEAWMD